MRVVDVTQWYAPSSGGIRTYLHAKARWAAHTGVEHAAVVTGPRAGERRVFSSPFVSVRGLAPGRDWGYRLAPRAYEVIRALERLAPDVLVLHDALAFPRRLSQWAARRGVPVMMVCHSDLRLATAGLARPLATPATAALAWAQRRALATPDLVLVASRASARGIGGLVRGTLVRSPLGVDLEPFRSARPDLAMRRRLAPDDAPLLLYAGRLSSEKRVDVLPAVLAALGGPAVLAIAGTGAASGRLMRCAERLGVAGRIRLLGHVAERERLAALMATADCFVHPNPAEPYGLAPLEALAAGCRVVAPDAAGSRETLRGRGAVLVPPGDPASLAAGVLTALGRPRPRPDLGDLAWDRTFAREWRCYRALAGAA